MYPTAEEIAVAQDAYMSDYRHVGNPYEFIGAHEVYAYLDFYGFGEGDILGLGYGDPLPMTERIKKERLFGLGVLQDCWEAGGYPWVCDTSEVFWRGTTPTDTDFLGYLENGDGDCFIDTFTPINKLLTIFHPPRA
jgi:hypothetical protein